MSSVAVLTPESFAEHRSGLKDQEITGEEAAGADFLLGPQRTLGTEMLLRLKCFPPRSSLDVSLTVYLCNLFSSPHLVYVCLLGAPHRLCP